MSDDHVPVLLDDVIDLTSPISGDHVLDVTLGLGGHAAAFLSKIGSDGHLTGCDTDNDNLERARKRLSAYKNVTYHHLNFAQLSSDIVCDVTILFADLGVSSVHLDDPQRGFSFRTEGPLDLRLDRSIGMTAAQYITRISDDDLVTVFQKYGELRGAHKLTKIIREHTPQTTMQLRECVERAYGYKAASVLPQVFQALRIAVNDELGALEHLLDVGPRLLVKGGRMAVISFHSLEDRLVKHSFRSRTTPEKDDRTGQIIRYSDYEIVNRKPVMPSADEVQRNPRSRSAVLRVIKRVHVSS